MKSNVLNKEVALQGDLECGKSVDFAGKIKGDIKAKQVIIRETAIIEGDIWYETLRVEEGATINGNLNKYETKLDNKK